MSEPGRRAYTRVPTKIAGFVRRVRTSSPTLAPEHDFLYSPGVDPRHLAALDLPRPALELLGDMNRKLETLAALMCQQRLSEDFPISVEIVEVSGGGLQLVSTEEEFEQDEDIEIVLRLEAMPPTYARARAVLKRQIASDDRKPWAVAFTDIRDNDRDSILGFAYERHQAFLLDQD